MNTQSLILEGLKNINESNDLKNDLMSKFKDLSSKDKKLIMSYNGYSEIEEDIEEGRKKDGSDWTADEVMDLLDRDDRVLYGALKHLYACQTDQEKNSASTREHNGKGFNAYDAEFLTSICKQLLQRGTLSQKQKEVARKKLKKYKTQLTALANS